MDKLVVIYTLPMHSNISHVILMMATLACAIITPAAGALLLLPSSSSVFAQQQEETSSLGEEREDLGSGIASNVLDNVGVEDEDEQQEEENDGAATATGDDGSTNTQIAVPITDQDQRDANLAEQLGLNADILEEEEVIPTPTPTPQEEDTTPPTLVVPEDIGVDPTSAQGAVVRYEVSATDNVDGAATLEQDGITVTQDDVGGDITISCTPASGSTFPIGTTTVNCEATDAAGNTATNSFTVTVSAVPDTTAPVIQVPPTIVVVPPSTAGAVVTFTVTAQDNVDGAATLDARNVLTQNDNVGGDITISCTPASGSTFEIDTMTTVTCTATDAAGNEGTASFTVTVEDITPTVFCLTVHFTGGITSTPCFSTQQECETGEEILTGSGLATILSRCAGFETLPAGGESCEIITFVDPTSGQLIRTIGC